jgi:hypothetical protein
MAKSKYTQIDEKYAKWFKEGWGQGTFENYKPWLTVFDVASHGRSHRIPSFKLNRIVTCFSDIEAARVYQLEHDPLVIDYHEQYPLCREKTLEIASRPEVSFAHPNDLGKEFLVKTEEDFPLSIKKKLQWLHQPLWYKTSDSMLMAFPAEFMALFTRFPNDGIAEISEYLELIPIALNR